MSQLLVIKKRLKSIESIYKVTKAMELVTKTKINHIRNTASRAKEYQLELSELYKTVAFTYNKKYPEKVHTNKKKEVHKYALCFLSHKGFCGNFNDKVLGKLLIRLAPFEMAKNIDLYMVGKVTHKCHAVIKRPFQQLKAKDSDYQALFEPLVEQWTQDILAGKNIEIYLVYNEFISILEQSPVVKQVYPLGIVSAMKNAADILLEPNIEDIYKELLKNYLDTALEKVYWEAQAGEYCSRLLSMKSANENASIMMKNLDLLYNKTRQMKITQELSEIVSAFDVLKQTQEKKKSLEEVSA